MTQGRLLRARRFAPFFWTQFLGALNDNVFKNALVISFTFGAATNTIDPGVLVNLAGGLLVLPFFLFSAIAGQLADRFEKTRIIRAVKGLEIAIMAVGAIGFSQRSAPILLTVLFLMGVHSTLFGPVKYSILPQHLGPDELVGGNALVEMGTFVAILLGTILGGVLAAGDMGPHVVSAVTIGIAVAGWVVCRGIPVAPAEDPSLRIRWNPLRETWRLVGFAREVHSVWLSILAIAWFWFYGALFLAQFPALGRDVLAGDERLVTGLLALFSVGIGVGCLLCERLSGRVVELGLVPFGAIGLTVFALDLAWASAHMATWRVAIDLVLIGAFGGFFIVPLLAFVQQRSDPRHLSRIIAANNVISAFFMVLAAGFGIGMRLAGASIPTIFAVAAVLNAAVALYIFTVIPEFLMRFIIWMLVHTVYRVAHRDLDHIPATGAAVIVSNHVSYVDALVIAAASRRPIRFVMDHSIFRMPILSFVFRTAKAIPIASQREDPERLARAYDDVARALGEGELVCIFPEGRLTRTGDMNPFRPGIERIVARNPVPVVPLALRGLWGSFFSRHDDKALRRPFRRVWSRIEIVCAPPVAPEAVSATDLEATVRSLRGDWP